MKALTALLALVVAVAVALGPMDLARASHVDGSYDLPVWFRWDRATLDVLIVPPNHGQIYNGNGVLNGSDPNELTPFNSYLAAVEASIADWDQAVSMFGEEWLRTNLVTNVYVMGRDSIPADALRNPEIIVATDETKANTLGVAVSTRPCLVDNSKFFVTSFTYEDMYNINAQEYGHCLGLEHVVDNHPQLDSMAGLYVHSPGAKGNPLHCVSNLDVRGLEAVFGRLFGQSSPDVASIPVAEYTTTCSSSGMGAPSPVPSSTSGPSSDPSPSSTSSPSPTPSPMPSESPSAAPDPHVHDRTVTMQLRRHVLATGVVTTGDDSGECFSHVAVEVARKKRSGWSTIMTVTTMSDGSYRARVPDQPGRYRVEVDSTRVDAHTCAPTTSSVRFHRHA